MIKGSTGTGNPMPTHRRTLNRALSGMKQNYKTSLDTENLKQRANSQPVECMLHQLELKAYQTIHPREEKPLKVILLASALREQV